MLLPEPFFGRSLSFQPKRTRRWRRRVLLERLEAWTLLASDWRDPVDALERNQDGPVAPLDLQVMANQALVSPDLPASVAITNRWNVDTNGRPDLPRTPSRPAGRLGRFETADHAQVELVHSQRLSFNPRPLPPVGYPDSAPVLHAIEDREVMPVGNIATRFDAPVDSIRDAVRGVDGGTWPYGKTDSSTGLVSIRSTAASLGAYANEFVTSGGLFEAVPEGEDFRSSGEDDAQGQEPMSTAGAEPGLERSIFPGERFDVGNNSTFVTLGDMNGDGRLDVLTTNAGGNNISLLLGNGHGRFQTQRMFAVGDRPVSMAIGDLNGDDSLDVITANIHSMNISVLLGNGDGTFQDQQTFAVGSHPTSVVVGDVNGDGWLDVVTANTGSWGVSLLIGKGDGTFEEQLYISVGDSPTSVTLGDVNDDTRLDLLTTNGGSASVSVLLGNGDGTFIYQGAYAVRENPRSISLGDINGDGALDLVTMNAGNAGSATVSLLFGQGDGTFQEQQTIAACCWRNSLSLADLNGDGRLDMITAGWGELFVLIGNGDGTFQTETQFPSTELRVVTHIALGDIDGDQRPDLISLKGEDGSNPESWFFVFIGNGDGSFVTPFVQSYPSGLALGYSFGDVNEDGILDLLSLSGSDVLVLLGNGEGAFEEQGRFTVGAWASSMILGDLNEDGNLDVLITGVTEIFVFLGNGDGTFQDQPKISGEGSGGAGFLSLGDVNGDGLLDLVTESRSGSIRVFLGTGDGTFTVGSLVYVAYPIVEMTLGDVNGDGRDDLILGVEAWSYYSSEVLVLLAKCDGTFQERWTFNGYGPRSLLLADVNDDGLPDLVVGLEWDETLVVLLGHGDGTFQEHERFKFGSGYLTALSSGDLNGDGRLDLITAHWDIIRVLYGNGDGSFLEQQLFYGGPIRIVHVFFHDMNGDELLDMVNYFPWAWEGYANTAVLLNQLPPPAPKEGPPEVTLTATRRVLESGSITITAALDAPSDEAVTVLLEFSGTATRDIDYRTPATTITIPAGATRRSIKLTTVHDTLGEPDETILVEIATVMNGTESGVQLVTSTIIDNDTPSVMLSNGEVHFQPSCSVAVEYTRRNALADVNGDGELDLIMTY